MAAAVMPVPIQQFLDVNGDPVAGGKLYGYQSGSSTPQNMYTDSALAVAFTNPIILNAAGQPSLNGTGVGLPVYLLATPAYDFTLTDADDVTIWTAVDVQAVSVVV